MECVVHQVLIDQTNALDIIKPCADALTPEIQFSAESEGQTLSFLLSFFIFRYDVVLDCTDNVATRYLLNDACVLLKKPLISGSAIRVEGQLTIYNHNNGPCYR